MKRKILAWVSISIAIGIIILAILYLIKGSFVMVVGIPVGIYIIFRFLPDVRGKVKQ